MYLCCLKRARKSSSLLLSRPEFRASDGRADFCRGDELQKALCGKIKEIKAASVCPKHDKRVRHIHALWVVQ